MEKDLKIIAEQAETNWADNWNFRSFLQHEIDPKVIDDNVQALNSSISAAIDCTACANCCRELQPHLEENDVVRVAAALDSSVMQMKKRHLVKDPDRTYRFSTKPCPLLNGTKCSIYKSRPVDCREYPHLNKPDFLGGSIGVIENYRVCPIVYNVYEELKKKFHYDKAVDYIGDTDPEAFSGSYWKKS